MKRTIKYFDLYNDHNLAVWPLSFTNTNNNAKMVGLYVWLADAVIRRTTFI